MSALPTPVKTPISTQVSVLPRSLPLPPSQDVTRYLSIPGDMTSPCAKHCRKGGPESMPEASVVAGEEGLGDGEGRMHRQRAQKENLH